jgi:hypothetical protein
VVCSALGVGEEEASVMYAWFVVRGSRVEHARGAVPK